MSRIRSSDTDIEMLLRRELWCRGYRYRVNCRKVYGKPDICFIGKKIAVFCDNEFWHGKDLMEGRPPKSNQGYWLPKQKRNIERDRKVTKRLEEEGWDVIRYWGKSILQNVDQCADEIENKLRLKE
jgi:DNA mismatch endonuclease, patch repair protein